MRREGENASQISEITTAIQTENEALRARLAAIEGQMRAQGGNSPKGTQPTEVSGNDSAGNGTSFGAGAYKKK